jgi:hypothetical protein
VRRLLLALLLLAAPALAGPRQDIADEYGAAAVRDGTRRWSDRELQILDDSLGALSRVERKALRGITIQRMGRSPQPLAAGLFKLDRRGGKRILIYDRAFLGDRRRERTNHAVLHEVAHAISAWDLLQAQRRMARTVAEYNDLVDASNRAIAGHNATARAANRGDRAARDRIDADRKRVERKRRAAEAARPDALAARRKYVALARDFKRRSPRWGVLGDYRKLLKGKRGPTRYGQTNLKESFAESFALFKTDKQALKRWSPEVLAWFERGGHTVFLR